MIVLNRIADNITGAYNGTSFAVSFSQDKWDAMKALQEQSEEVETVEEYKQILEQFEPLTKETYKEIIEAAHPSLGVSKNGTYYLRFPDGSFDVAEMPEPLARRILTTVEKGDDPTPVIKMWIRFRRNPNFSANKAAYLAQYLENKYFDTKLYNQLLEAGQAEEVAQELAICYQTSITREGLLVTYKVSTEITDKYELDADGNKVVKSRYKQSIDEVTGIITYEKPTEAEDFLFQPAIMGTSGDAFFCGDVLGHVIKVGQRHYLENWDQVDCKDGISCVKGLHCGNLDYIRSYQTPGTVTHNIFVDPMYIGAFTGTGDGAIRVKEYFVHGTTVAVNKNMYHSSKYAKQGDAMWVQMLAEIQATATKEREERAKKEAAQDNALANL